MCSFNLGLCEGSKGVMVKPHQKPIDNRVKPGSSK